MDILDKHLISEAKKKGKKYSNRDIEEIVSEASEDFWARVAEMVPEATTGDLDPGTVVKLEKVMGQAVKAWIDYNTPPSK